MSSQSLPPHSRGITALLRFLLTALLAGSAVTPSAVDANDPLLPKIDGDWWQVAGDPDLGEHTSPRQQPVDFAIWQAADGSWQLWSCIRNTKCGGNTRLFHRWEGQKLTDSDWTPKGIAMEAAPSLGETAGGLQAPHVIRHDDGYVMVWRQYGFNRDVPDGWTADHPGGVGSGGAPRRGPCWQPRRAAP